MSKSLGAAVDPLMQEIATLVRSMNLSKADGQKLMQDAIGMVKGTELLKKEEAAKFIAALTAEQARRETRIK